MQGTRAVINRMQSKKLARMSIRDPDLKMSEIWQLVYCEGAATIVLHDRADDTPEDVVGASNAEHL